MSPAACLLSLLLGDTAAAQDSATISVDRPGQEAAVALIDAVWDDLPEDGVIIYLSCQQEDCAGQTPAWFTMAAWEEGLGEAGVYDPEPALGPSPTRLRELRTIHRHPPVLAARLADEFIDGGLPVRAVLLVYPNLRGEKLELSYQLHYARSERRDLIGRLTVRLPPPPPPMPPPPEPYRSKPVVWVGAGVMAAGAATVAVSSVLLVRGDGPETQLLSVTTATGWLGVMGGGAMMLVPAVYSDAVIPTLRVRF
ncbi:MAG: hypothetical protein ACI8S6_002043 [Myxococcota bacterium]|jgi:hypothetical protein